MNLSRLLSSAALCAAALAAPARPTAAPSTVAELPEGTVLVVKRALPVRPGMAKAFWAYTWDTEVDVVGGKVVVVRDDPAAERDVCSVQIKYPEGKKAIPGNKIAAGTPLTVTKVERNVSQGDGFFSSGYDFVTLKLDHPAAFQLTCHLRQDGPMPMDVFYRTVRGVLEVRLPGEVEDSAAPSGVVGAWRTPCLRKGRQNIKMQLSFAPDGTYTERITTAIDNGCSAPLSVYAETGRWSVAGGGKLDVHTDAVALTFFTGNEWSEEIQTVKSANEGAFCGFTDWKSGEARDVTGLECDGTVQKPRGDWYTSFKRCRDSSGACVPPEPGHGDLFLAWPRKANPGSDPRKRLTQLDRETWVLFPDR